MESRQWPPEDGKEFIRSEAFGALLVDLTSRMAAHYPAMDFTDAVAQVFVWFDRKLSVNRRFINSRRFPTLGAFKAYLRQAVWNAARLTMRERRRRQAVEVLPLDRAVLPAAKTADERVRVLELVEALPEPHKTIFYRIFFDEEDLPMIASIHNLTEARVEQLFEEAVDMLEL
jgi:hypothetical protein